MNPEVGQDPGRFTHYAMRLADSGVRFPALTFLK
jgi:hypothetical protein